MRQVFIILIVVALCSTVASPLSLVLLHGLTSIAVFVGFMLIAGFAWTELLVGDWDFLSLSLLRNPSEGLSLWFESVKCSPLSYLFIFCEGVSRFSTCSGLKKIANENGVNSD